MVNCVLFPTMYAASIKEMGVSRISPVASTFILIDLIVDSVAQCNKMTCPNCQTLSCYICRKVITGYEHFSQVSIHSRLDVTSVTVVSHVLPIGRHHRMQRRQTRPNAPFGTLR